MQATFDKRKTSRRAIIEAIAPVVEKAHETKREIVIWAIRAPQKRWFTIDCALPYCSSLNEVLYYVLKSEATRTMRVTLKDL